MLNNEIRGHSGRDRMIVGTTTICNQCRPITTNVVGSNPVHCGLYSIQRYVIKFASDLRQVGYFLWVLRFPDSRQ
jgi:hypothetical protein